MAEYATKNDVQEIVNTAVDKAVTDLSAVIANFAQQVDSRFNQVEAKVVGIESRLESVESRLENVEVKVVGLESRLERIEEKVTEQDQKFDRLLNTIDGFVGRIDRYEAEQIARDGQFNRLLEWARKVSAQTGIPLENL